MDCLGYCSATLYQIKPLFESFRSNYKTTLYRDVLHVELSSPTDGRGDLFFFPYGAAVFWNVSKEVMHKLLKEATPFADQLYEEVEIDEFTYLYDKNSPPKIVEDEIILPDQEVLTKLAISHCIAQSVKLGAFEVAVQKTFNSMQYIPNALAQFGKIPLSRREIRRKMGALFIERNSIAMHVNVLDTPELFWDYPELEPLYKMMANDLELEKRGHVLNQRLTMIQGLFEMLGTELNHQHSNRLEWTIIWLIVIEVVITLMSDVFRVL